MNDLITCHNCDTQGTTESLTEIGPNAYECERCWKTIGGDELTPQDKLDAATCQFCQRSIELDGGLWVDRRATGDDIIWRETCDANDTFTARHESK